MPTVEEVRRAEEATRQAEAVFMDGLAAQVERALESLPADSMLVAPFYEMLRDLTSTYRTRAGGPSMAAGLSLALGGQLRGIAKEVVAIINARTEG